MMIEWKICYIKYRFLYLAAFKQLCGDDVSAVRASNKQAKLWGSAEWNLDMLRQLLNIDVSMWNIFLAKLYLVDFGFGLLS